MVKASLCDPAFALLAIAEAAVPPVMAFQRVRALSYRLKTGCSTLFPAREDGPVSGHLYLKKLISCH